MVEKTVRDEMEFLKDKPECQHEWLPHVTKETQKGAHRYDPATNTHTVTQVFCRFCLQIEIVSGSHIGPKPEEIEK